MLTGAQAMTQRTVVLLEWTFSPGGYFEEPIEICRDDYIMTIVEGKVQATIDSAMYEADSEMRQRLHDSLNDRFLSVQLFNHRSYELSRSSMTRLHPNGRKDIFLEIEPARIVVSATGTLDVLVTDKEGTVIADSKRDRIERQKKLADLVAVHGKDAVLASLLRSRNAAVRDPNNELIHLYEIRDALSKQFDGDAATQNTLPGIKAGWSRFGNLCNNMPLRQGRHRGNNVGVLRDATERELVEARDYARVMIEAYLQYLEERLHLPLLHN